VKKSTIKEILKKVALRSESSLEPLEQYQTDFTPPPTIDTSGMSYKDKLKCWRNGGAGFIQWCEDNVNLAIYEEGSDIPKWLPMGDMPKAKNPLTDRSYHDCWNMQKPILMEALQMHKGRFKYRVIVLCWMRGDGKSLIACLIQLWKFFCFPKQQIMLGANSKDQVKFVHYDIMREIILNSPNLLSTVGERNIQEKEIRLQNSKGVNISIIRSISSFSGIVSNITGYTFSEIFDMKNPKFFVQLDGSTRNMPNALGIIDSTVSAKSHILYKLWQSWLENKHKSMTFFSYRCSVEGSYKDFFNPQMTQAQLDDYRMKFPPAEFDRYFRNVWESGVGKVFSEDMVEATRILSVHPSGLPQPNTNSIQQHLYKIRKTRENMGDAVNAELAMQTAVLRRSVRPLSDIIRLDQAVFFNSIGTAEQLKMLSDYYDTDWAIGVGVDRADPMKNVTHGARTITSIVAKGLPGSRSNSAAQYMPNAIHSYIYVVLGLNHIADNSLNGIKEITALANVTFDGIDMLCAERWGMFDIIPWLEENEIKSELIQPNMERQKMAFSEMFIIVSTERFKCPLIGIAGSKMDDIYKEEMITFEQSTADKLWYGSPEKSERYGIQDDCIFSLVWNIYGMRNLTVDHFRPRGVATFMGMYYENKQVMGRY
jgi:hypothetical protein